MAQSYKKGRKFKTESPALLSITRGGRPAAAPRPLPSAFRLCAPATIPASVPPSVSALCAVARTPLCASASIPTSVLPSASVSRTSALTPPLCVAVGNCSLCRRSYTSLRLCQHPRLCAAVGIRSPHLSPHPRFCAAVCLPPLDSRRRTLSAPRKAGEGCPR